MPWKALHGIVTALTLLVWMSASPSLAQAAKPGLYDDGLHRMEKDYRDGKLNYTEALNYRVAAIFHPEELPQEYRPTYPIRSATMILREAMVHRFHLTAKNKRVLFRPTDSGDDFYYGDGVPLCSYVSSGGHFRLHYTTDNRNGDAVSTTDANQNQVPDYVEQYAEYLEEAWTREVEQMGFNAPAADGLLGGDCLLDVYIKDLNAYGLTVYEIDPSDVYLIVENDYAGFPPNLNGDCDSIPGNQADCRKGAMKVTAAHEFFHTIHWQMSTDCCTFPTPQIPHPRDATNGWWMEASATWMEDAVFPEVKDYLNYVAPWFAYPDYPLDTFDGSFEYGTVIWAKHLSEKYGEGIVREIWLAVDDAAPVNALAAIEQVLTDHGSSLAEELVELRAKNAAVRYWDTPYVDGQYYLGPDMAVYGDDTSPSSTENYPAPVSGDCTFDFSGAGPCVLTPLSSFYYIFLPPTTGTLSVAYAHVSGSTASVLVIPTTQPILTTPGAEDRYVVSELSLNGSQQGEVAVGPLDPDSNVGPQEAFKRVMVVVVNTSDTDVSRGTLTVSFASGGSIQPVSSLAQDPLNASIDSGGRLQYRVLMQDGSTAQVLAPGLSWSSDSPAVGDFDGNGLATMQTEGAIQVTASHSLNAVTTLPTILTGAAAQTPTPGNGRACDSSQWTQEICSSMLPKSTGNSDDRCFIATAAFGTPLHPYVRVLREFRDRYLIPSSIGRSLVAFYYEHSPGPADWIARHEAAKAVAAALLIPVITFAAFMVKVSLLEKMALLLVILWGLVKVRRNVGSGPVGP